MNRRGLIFGTVLISIVLGLSWNGEAQQKPIRWGVDTALQHEAGIGAKNATELAAQEINAAGGILGRKVEVFYADDEANPEKGINAVKKLIYEDKVDFISGGFMSGVSLAQAEYIFGVKKIWFSVGAATPKLSTMVKENYNKSKYFFRVGCVNSDWFAYSMAVVAGDFFNKELGLEKVALLPESSVYAREIAEYLQKDLPKRGMKVVYMDVFDPKRTDFSPQFAQIKDKGAQLLITVQSASPGVPMIKQWADTQLPVHLESYNLASQVLNFWEKTDGRCNGEVTMLVNGGRAPITSRTIPFYDKYLKTYNLSPTYTAWGGYDALYLLKAAAEQAKTLDTEVLIKTLENIKFEGAAGMISFTPDHDLKYGKEGKQPVFAQWQNGKHIIVWPSAWATGKYIYPAWLKK